MDGERFDHLTRRLAASLPRRRLLRRAAGLAGGLLAGRVARVSAITCPAGQLECDDRCCDPGWECLGAAFPRLDPALRGRGEPLRPRLLRRQLLCWRDSVLSGRLDLLPEPTQRPTLLPRVTRLALRRRQRRQEDLPLLPRHAHQMRRGQLLRSRVRLRRRPKPRRRSVHPLPVRRYQVRHEELLYRRRNLQRGRGMRGRLPGRRRRAAGRRPPVAPAGGDGGGGVPVVPGRPRHLLRQRVFHLTARGRPPWTPTPAPAPGRSARPAK